jgi:membrane protease YdiL (CAAX protease family)
VTVDRWMATRCNIGPDEVARRRRTAITTTILFVIVATVTILLDIAPLARLLIWPLAAAVGVTWLQVTSRFCVAFGALGFEIFGRLGRQVRVDGKQRGLDRRRAFLLIVEGAVIGLALTLAIIPLRL